jgi:hypothetical protein
MGDVRIIDLSLVLGVAEYRDKKTGLREGEFLYEDADAMAKALKFLRKHQLDKCKKLIETSLLAVKKCKLNKKRVKKDFTVVKDSLRISDSFVSGPARVIYKIDKT